MSLKTNPEDRCWFTYSDGRRCRMPRMPSHDMLCVDHWKREEELLESHKVCLEILGPSKNLDTAVGVNFALAKLFCLVAEGRLPPRHATSMAYICQLLLCSLPLVKAEVGPARPEKEDVLKDIPPELFRNDVFKNAAVFLASSWLAQREKGIPTPIDSMMDGESETTNNDTPAAADPSVAPESLRATG